MDILKQKSNIKFWIKSSIVFGLLALGFSLLGFSNDESDSTKSQNPLDSATFEHIFGHILWGMIVAVPTLSFRYVVASGLFAILLDADHFIELFGFDMVSRMGHSIPFAIIAVFAMMMIFGRKDYLLGAISFAAILAHLSFDTFLNSGKFPLFTPFYFEPVFFSSSDWFLILVSAFAVVGSIKFILFRKNKLEKEMSSDR